MNSAKPFGAGDAFLANLLISLGEDGDVKAAVLHGSAAAAYVVSRSGCASAMPDKKQLQQFMSENEILEFEK